MSYFKWTGIIYLICVCIVPSAIAKEVKVNYKADRVEYLKGEDLFRLIGNVKVKVKDITIETDQLDYDTLQKRLSSSHDFIFTQTNKKGEKTVIKGKSFKYDVKIKRLEALDVYLVVPAKMEKQEVYIKGDSMTAYDNGKRVVFTNGFYTTCHHFHLKHQAEKNKVDPYHPDEVKKRIVHYAIDADILDFVKGKRLIAWNATTVLFDMSAFWFPFWYVPLDSVQGYNPPKVDTGQNPVEGNFIKFKGNYSFNEYHDGRWFLKGMQLKGLGLGFEHDWVASPNSLTRIYFYGLPVSTQATDLPSQLFYPPPLSIPQDPAASTTQQVAQTQISRFLDPVSQYGSSKFEDHHFLIKHKQRLLPYTETAFEFEDMNFYSISNFKAPKNTRQRFDWKLSDSQNYAVDANTNLSVDTKLGVNQSVNKPTTINYVDNNVNDRTERTSFTQSQRRTATVTTRLGKNTNLTLNTNWGNSENSSSTKTFKPELPDPQQTSTPVTGNENWVSNLNLNTQINKKLSLTSRLAYNSTLSSTSQTAIKTLQPTVSLNQKLDWGSMSLKYEDFFSFVKGSKNQARLKRIPEWNLNVNPFFKKTFPVQLKTTIGRYFEEGSQIQAADSTDLTDPTTFLSEIARTRMELSLTPKAHDLGMGMILNFGGTRFEQRFYQTQDAEYGLTANIALQNQLSPYFIPRLTYTRTILDEVNNNSPFENFEPLSLGKRNSMTGSLNLVNIPEFTWTINSGYDYLSRRYNAVRTAINSKIGSNFILNFQTQYTPIHIIDSDVGKKLKDTAKNIYEHGEEKRTFDVTQADVGSFSPYGGRWGNTTLGFRYRSSEDPLVFGSLSNFGRDKDIPQGLEFGSALAYDFHTGRINALNTVLKFAFGDNWLWHTELELTASVQPTLVPINGEELQNLVLGIPFKLVVRKDLHDFLFTASWDSFYQQFQMDLTLLAFPSISSSKLVGDLNSELKKADQNSQKLNQQINNTNK